MGKENLGIRYFIFGSVVGVFGWMIINWVAIYIFNI